MESDAGAGKHQFGVPVLGRFQRSQFTDLQHPGDWEGHLPQPLLICAPKPPLLHLLWLLTPERPATPLPPSPGIPGAKTTSPFTPSPSSLSVRGRRAQEGPVGGRSGGIGAEGLQGSRPPQGCGPSTGLGAPSPALPRTTPPTWNRTEWGRSSGRGIEDGRRC